MARPSKLNEELINKCVCELEQGLPINYTCDLLSITVQSFFNWMNKGEKDFNESVETLEAQFFDSIKKAQATFVKNEGKAIRKGEAGWQARAWWLERTRQDFMPRQKVEANTEDGKVTVVIGGGKKVKDVKRDNDK